MSVHDSRVPSDWFKRGEEDLAATRFLLGQPESTFIIPAAMLLQQAVEKYLKGFLIAKGHKLRRIHDLSELLDEALTEVPELARFDEACIKITEYYTEQRYPPLVSSDLTREEVLSSLRDAEELIEEIKKRLW